MEAVKRKVGVKVVYDVPDFIVHLDDGHGQEDPLQLLIEVSGQPNQKKEAKTSTAETLWVPAVNNAGEWGRWGFVEITDPWDAVSKIRECCVGSVQTGDVGRVSVVTGGD